MPSAKRNERRPLLDPAELDIPPITENPRYRAAADQISNVKARLAQTFERQRQARAVKRGAAKVKSTSAAAAEALLAGGQVQGWNADSELEACACEAEILKEAIAKLERELEDVVADFSLEMCNRFRGVRDDAHRTLYEAIAQLHEATATIFALDARLRAAGCQGVEGSLEMMIPRNALLLGDPRNRFYSQAGEFRAWLIERRILPEVRIFEGWYVD